MTKINNNDDDYRHDDDDDDDEVGDGDDIDYDDFVVTADADKFIYFVQKTRIF